MTCGEAIERARRLRAAAMEEMPEMYYRWLTEVENEIIENYNRCEPFAEDGGEVPEIDPDTGKWMEEVDYQAPDPDTQDPGDEETEMLLPTRFMMIYVYKLMCEIDMTVGETDRYNNDATLYNQLMAEFRAWLRRERTPRNVKRSGWILV